MTNSDNVTGIRAGSGADASAAQEPVSGFQATVHAAIQARVDGRHDDALGHLQAAFARVVARDSDPRTCSDFMPVFEWEQLAGCHPPARAALSAARDEQARRLLAGDETYGAPHPGGLRARSRLALVVSMDRALEEGRATAELFARLDARQPGRVPYGFLALPAAVEAGDFVLAARYLPDPMRCLAEVNETIHTWPLLPLQRGAPRSWAALSNFAAEVRLRAAILCGLGRHREAAGLVDAAMTGLVSDEMRALARQELDSPGAIIRALVGHQMAAEDDADGHRPQA